MKSTLFIQLALLFVIIFPSQSQDLHQTNFRYSPLYLNPSNVGSFSGNIRVGGMYRSQFNSFIVNGFQTQQINVDMPLGYGFRKNDWVGVGVHLFNDKAGDLALSNSGVLVGVGYHLALDKKRKRVFSFGVQYGLSSRKLDDSKISVETDFRALPGGQSMDRQKLMDFNGSIRDINIGVKLTNQIDKNSSLGFGVAMFHLLRPSYEGVKLNYVDQRLTSHLNYERWVSKRINMNYEVIASVSMTNDAHNIMPQITSSYKLSKKKDNSDLIYFGLGYRLQDALQAMVGMNYKKWDFGVSYDFTVSSASVYNNHNGAIEFGVFRIFDIPKTPKVIPLIMCPRL